MTRSLRTAAALAAVCAVLLSGCTAREALPAVGTTAAPASDTGFTCPTTAEVAALAAVPLTSGTTGAAGCTYSATTDAESPPTMTVRHPGAGDAATLASLRYAAASRGETTADLRSASFDAFTSATSAACTAWFSAPDGVLTSVVARLPDGSPGRACEAASATASLVGAGEPAAAGATVAVVAPQRLLGASTTTAAWPWRVAAGSAIRVDRLTGTGYVDAASSASYARVGAGVPEGSTAVVVVSGTEEAGAPRMDVLRGVTATVSAIESQAKDADVIVVGPVADGRTPYSDLVALRADLRAAAALAEVGYFDPTAARYATSGRASLDAIADGIAGQLVDAGIVDERQD